MLIVKLKLNNTINGDRQDVLRVVNNANEHVVMVEADKEWFLHLISTT